MSFNFVWMNAAKDQQVVILWKVMQCSDNRVDPLVPPEKSKHPNQFAFFGHGIEYRKLTARCSATNLLRLRCTNKCERMVVHITHTVNVFHVFQIAAGVHNQRDRLLTFRPAGPGGERPSHNG